jgi:hypothetical protein
MQPVLLVTKKLKYWFIYQLKWRHKSRYVRRLYRIKLGYSQLLEHCQPSSPYVHSCRPPTSRCF